MKVICELDWIPEDISIEEEIENRIVKEAASIAIKNFSENVIKKIEEKASASFAQKVDELCNNLLERFMDKEIMVTDNWGDVQAKYESVEELLKAKFDNFMTQKVDKNGKVDKGCHWGSDKPYTRIDYILDKQIQEHANRLTDQIAKEVNEKIELAKKKIHQKTIAKIVSKLGLEES